MLVGDRPAAVALLEADGESEAELRGGELLLLGGALQQRPGEAHVSAGRYLELGDVKGPGGFLPLEEGRPRRSVGIDAADALVGRGDVEHDDVLAVVGEHSAEVADAHGCRPVDDELTDEVVVVADGRLLLVVGLLGRRAHAQTAASSGAAGSRRGKAVAATAAAMRSTAAET